MLRPSPGRHQGPFWARFRLRFRLSLRLGSRPECAQLPPRATGVPLTTPMLTSMRRHAHPRCPHRREDIDGQLGRPKPKPRPLTTPCLTTMPPAIRTQTTDLPLCPKTNIDQSGPAKRVPTNARLVAGFEAVKTAQTCSLACSGRRALSMKAPLLARPRLRQPRHAVGATPTSATRCPDCEPGRSLPERGRGRTTGPWPRP